MKRTKKEMPNPIRRIGTFPQDSYLTYWLFSDGNVYYCDHKPLSNCGPLAEFLEQAKAGKWRIALD